MKKILRVLLSLVLVVVLAGCVKYDFTMGINSDKSVNLEIIYAMDVSAMEEMNTGGLGDSDDDNGLNLEPDGGDTDADSGVSTDDYSFLEQKGYKVEEYEEKTTEHDYKGVKISKKFASIDDITKDTEKVIDFNAMFSDSTNFDDSQLFSKSGNTYKASYLFDFTDNGTDVSADYKDYQSMFKLSYKVTLPNKPISGDATSVSSDGKTLTWEFVYGKKNSANFSFEFGKDGSGVKPSGNPTGDNNTGDNKTGDNNTGDNNTGDNNTNTTGDTDTKKDTNNDSKSESKDSNMMLYVGIGAAVVAVLIVVIVMVSKKNSGQAPVANATPASTPSTTEAAPEAKPKTDIYDDKGSN